MGFVPIVGLLDPSRAAEKDYQERDTTQATPLDWLVADRTALKEIACECDAN